MFVDVDEGDVGLEGKRVLALLAPLDNLDIVGDGGATWALFRANEAEDAARLDGLFEDHLIHAHSDELSVWIIERGGDEARLIDPAEHATAEELAVLVEVFLNNESVSCHGVMSG